MIAERLTNKLRNFLEEDPRLGAKVTHLDLNKLTAEIHMNRGATAAEMNQPEQALKSRNLFNQIVKAELGDEHPGTDMRLAISFNELGVGHMLNNSEFFYYRQA